MEPSSHSLADIDPERLDRLDRAWVSARAAGAVGGAPIEALRLHAGGYILDEWRTLPAGQFVDCGTGAGVLGVLLALELPRSQWCLVDARERRCEMAQRAVAAAGLTERVTVVHALVDEMARADGRGGFDGAVARSFGPVPELAECALPLLNEDGSLVVSVSASTARRWQQMPLAVRTGCEIEGTWTTPYGSYLSVKRFGPIPASLPRRRPARCRSPLG
ncbi:MAG: methyltransferase [Acidimicrobiaceae bacterium]|nr:methyltransferase [Acidimicrobiaceae bacterium]